MQINEGRIQAHLDEVTRSTVDETLNALLNVEADQYANQAVFTWVWTA